ncbi:MAG: Dam family site-specific DNA-(adenine-N6)-methyltransferase [Candidatus Obscuribacterales bacterium]|nr:Dam family site-specific DNA-(adenine-N6)-methyltransferase [Candidatus Obscuribacterales bacterium]
MRTDAAKAYGSDGFLKPGLKLIGAKQGFQKISGRSLIYEMLDLSADSYVEPFLGSGSILVGKEPQRKEWANDINPYVINFYQVMQKHPEELWDHICALTDYMQKEHDRNAPYYKFFHHLRDSQEAPEGIEGALWYYLVTKFCMNGIVRFNSSGRCNSAWSQTYTGRGIYNREWFDMLRQRIAKVKFTNLTYQQVLKKVAADSIVVLDPPYQKVFTSYNRIKFSDVAHFELAGWLRIADYRWLLTINDTPLIRKLYAGFNMREVKIAYSCSQTAKGRGKKDELFITNY